VKALSLLLVFPLNLFSPTFGQQEYFPVAKGTMWEYRVTFAASASLPYRPEVEYPEGILGSSIFCGMGTWSAGQISFEVSAGDIAEKTSTSTTWNLAPNLLMSKFLFPLADTSRDRYQIRLTNDGTTSDLSAILLFGKTDPWRLVRHLSRLAPTDLGQQFAISVPAGQFPNCVSCTMKLYGDGTYVPTGTYPVETYLARGVAIVKAIGKSSSNATLYTLELTRFTAGSAVSVERENAVPKKLALLGNYPNPFNPSTRIELALPNPRYAHLAIYNSLGIEIETLIKEYLPAGHFRIKCTPRDKPSGVYFYQMKAGDFVETKKLLLLK